MSEVPKGWAAATLGDVLTFERGLAFPSTDKHHEPGDGLIACLRTTNVQAEVDWSDLWFIPREHVKNPVKLVRPNDILMSTANSQALVGKVSRVRSMPMEATFGAFIGVLRPVEAVSPGFVHYRVGSGEFQERLRGTASQTTNIANISSSAMLELPVDLPPLNEQRRIVEKLDAIFDKSRAAKARLERLPALLEKLKRSILAAAFRGDLTKEWRAAHPDVEPASVLLKRICAERRRRWEEGLRAKGKDPKKATYEEPAPVDVAGLPELPEHWAWASLGEVATFHNGDRGKNYPNREEYVAEGGVPFINTGHIEPDGSLSMERMNFITREKRDSLGGGKVVVGDLVYCLRGATLGKTAFVDERVREGAIASSLVIVRPDDLGCTPYLYQYLVSPLGRAEISKYDNGTAQPNLSAESVSRYLLPMPPAAEMDAIGVEIRAAFDLIRALERATGHTALHIVSFEQAALAKAFRGELVPQDPTDEPASALLDRIRAARADEPQRARRGRPARPADPELFAAKPAAPRATNGHGAEDAEGAPVELVVAAFQLTPRLTATSIGTTTGLDTASVKKALKALVDGGHVRVEGKARGTSYVWAR